MSRQYNSKISDLKNSEDSQDLITHADYVVDYYRESNKKRSMCHDFLRGNQFNDRELTAFKNKRKTPIVFNKLKSSERTILGLFIQNKYDVKFSPWNEDDNKQAAVLEKLRIWESQVQNDAQHDLATFQEAWVGGNSFQECFMDVIPGKEPVMVTQNVSPFAVHFDPDSRIPVTREDAQFYDVHTYMSVEELVDAFPLEKDRILEDLRGQDFSASAYEKVPVYKDNSVNDRIEKNGKYVVIERYYKVKEAYFFSYDDNEEMQEIKKEHIDSFREDFPEREIEHDFKEYLYVAVACQAMNSRKYLYNGMYHAQPREIRSQNIIWPHIEMVAESLLGDPSGFVEHEIAGNKAINSLMSNVLHSAKQDTSQAKLMDKSRFLTEREANRAAKMHTDADAVFNLKPGEDADRALSPIRKAPGLGNDTYQGINLAQTFLEEVSSTPPSLKGSTQKSGVSGVLNAQMIEQSFTQLQVMTHNYRQFLKRKYELRMAYWLEFYDYEKVVRVAKDPTEDEEYEYLTVNKQVPEVDEYGMFTGEVTMENALDDLEYDIVVEDSTKSPTYRHRIQQQISEMINSPAMQVDPVTMQALALEWVKVSDASPGLKNTMKKNASLTSNWEIQRKQNDLTAQQLDQQLKQQQSQGADLANQAAEQQIAQTEAEQTLGAEEQAVMQPFQQEASGLSPEQEEQMRVQGLLQ